MGKTLGSWSGMRKYLEDEMTADALKGRVRYSCAAFPGMDGSRIFGIHIDGQTVKQFSMETVAGSVFHGKKPVDKIKYWEAYWAEKENTPLEKRGEYDDTEFAEALRLYRAMPIGQALYFENPVVRMFAILDRRAGGRTLAKIAEQLEEQPEWLRYFYRLRFCAEGIPFRGEGEK